MKVVEGWTCPDLLSGPGKYMARTVDALPALKLANGPVAIQAGGHIGTWPVFLAKHFAAVYTFEPDWENFTALQANLHAQGVAPYVFAARGVLGDKPGLVAIRRSTKSTGQHRVDPHKAANTAVNTAPTFRIDDLGLRGNVGGIFLDVEGSEIRALRGAKLTIAYSRPVIMAEENKRAIDQGYRIGQLREELEALDYVQVVAVREDLIFAPKERLK